MSLMGSATREMPMVDKNIIDRGPKLTNAVFLCQSVTDEEIKQALWSMDSNKAPGMDGFNAYFFKQTWAKIGNEVCMAIKSFFNSGYLPKTVNATLLTLLPKMKNPSTIRDYRPIACCSIIYKLISKVLANRMQGILGELISESQSAFVKGRVIHDNILISHELIKGYSRKNISPRCMVKVDIQKAYDSVEWPFVQQLLLELGFPYKFMKWVMACVKTVSYTVNVNGELTEPFQARKGLRQGDPISPYLFVLCMEYLSRCLMELKTDGDFNFHPRCRKVGLIHLCFADDLLMFTRGDLVSVRKLMTTFEKFSSTSGLKANPAKSNIYFGGVSREIQEAILGEFGLVVGELPFKYLGVPLSSKKLSVMQCQPLIHKILERIESWTSKLLSYTGRIQLIKSVLFSMQSFWCQVFLLPQKVVKIIQQACRSFLWTGSSGVTKRALVAWEHLCQPKAAGEWNIIHMKLWNQASICKLLWSLAQKQDKIWVKWVHGFYIKGRDLITMKVPDQASWVIRKIVEARKYLEHTRRGVGVLADDKFSTRKLYKKLQASVWQKLNDWCQLRSASGGWDQEKAYLVTQCGSNTGRQGMYRVIVSIAVYFIWKERNQRKFRHKEATVEEVVKQCKLHVAWSCGKDRKLARFMSS